MKENNAATWAGEADYSDRVVLLTGDTGFKGSWLAHWLITLGAKVVGIGLDPDTTPSLFEALELEHHLTHHCLDVRNEAALTKLVLDVQPDYVFHLAAQSLVRQSYAAPTETFATNVMGTVHLLNALRELGSRYIDEGRHCAAVLITSDKCYENREEVSGYREDDVLGGKDPYSASKAAAETAIACFRSAYFDKDGGIGLPAIGVASARAGNALGGGDWSEDRILPDCVRRLETGEPIKLRNPGATRPWQHVLEPLHGYLTLAAEILRSLETGDRSRAGQLLGPFNFGPDYLSDQSVRRLVEEVLKHWPGNWVQDIQPDAPAEADKLSLVSDKAHELLNWRPVWSFEEMVERTAKWYRQYVETGTSAIELVDADIHAYCLDCADNGISRWKA